MSDSAVNKTEITTDKTGNTLVKSSALLKALLEGASAGPVNNKPSPHIVPGV